MASHSATSILTFSIFTIIIFFTSSPVFITIARAQGRAPHGLVYEGPVAFSPSAVEFFHPSKQLPSATVMQPCQESSGCSPLPVAAQVTTDEESKMTSSSSHGSRNNGLGPGGIVGIVFGVAFAVFLAMGVYYVVSTRRANLSKGSNSVQPHV